MIYLTLNNHDGSVEHYYHFLLGFLVPLVLWKKEYTVENSRKILLRSCEIMDRHLFEIGYKRANILDKVSHEVARTKKDHCRECIFVERVGYDKPSYYNFVDFSAANLILSEILSEDIARYTEKFNSNRIEDHPYIVMIDREPPNHFYLSQLCESQGSGRSRRSIQNYRNLFESVALQYKNVVSFTLEEKTLAFQIALFKQADVIIAQHGAALANLIWCKPNTTVIEIHPLNISETIMNRNYFLNLANCMKLDYQRVEQEGCHSVVDPNSLLRILKNAIDGYR
jgi:hypothetical protein